MLACRMGERRALPSSALTRGPAAREERRPQSLSTSPIGSQFAPLNVASCNWRIGLKFVGEVLIVMPGKQQRRAEVLEIGGLPHDVLARQIVPALLEHLHDRRRVAKARGREAVDELGRRQVFRR